MQDQTNLGQVSTAIRTNNAEQLQGFHVKQAAEIAAAHGARSERKKERETGRFNESPSLNSATTMEELKQEAAQAARENRQMANRAMLGVTRRPNPGGEDGEMLVSVDIMA
ncbi:MAG: hypothetical protein HQL53_14845 [Magnetococcales bacterium]|nr:hypothetical protein [Magnetococcales bacterium]